MPTTFPDELYSQLVCICSAAAPLGKCDDALVCRSCGARHPIVDGVPVILHPEDSIFDREEIIGRYRARSTHATRGWFARLRRFVPRIASSLVGRSVADSIRDMLKGVPRPRILVVGAGESGGAGMQVVLDDPGYCVVASDIYFGARCNIIADGHGLPFQDGSFDAVICQSVLEHVVRPQACIDEIHRVLKSRGVFFADIPFMYPVHMGANDFARLSLGGLRLACRRFEEFRAGVSGGPFQAIAVTIFHSFRILSRSRLWAVFVWFVLPWFIFWLHHIDKLFKHRPEGSDVASGVYFLGRKTDRVRSEREIIRQYWRYQIATRRT